MKKITFNKRYLWLGLVIILGFLLRFYEEEPSSLWTDELATYWISSAETLKGCVVRATPTQGQSPFYYMLVWGVLKVLPHSETSLRLISTLCSVISLVLIFYLALIMFSGVSIFEESEEEEKKSLIDSGAYLPALLSALLLALSQSAIYYSQEARPYSLAVMFCLISQIFFIRSLKRSSPDNLCLYIISSSLICYSHYVFGTLMLTQNIWMLYLFQASFRKKGFSFKENRADDVSLLKWCLVQIILIITLLPLVFHLVPILSAGSKWNWLPRGGLVYVLEVFFEILDSRFVIFAFALFIFLISFKNLRFIWRAPKPDDEGACCCFVDAVTDNTPHMLFFLFIWFLTPPLFVYAVTNLSGTSIIAPRYMILSYIPLFLIGGWAVSAIKNRNAKYVFICLILFFNAANFLIPTFMKEGRFSKRITHDWRRALGYVDNNCNPGDSILLRTGLVKENWITESKDPVIHKYVKSPLKSFYVKKDNFGNVYNLTFSPSMEFSKYYDKIFANLAKSPRVWIIGVSQPNGFPIENVEKQLSESHEVKLQNNFSGVYVALLVKK